MLTIPFFFRVFFHALRSVWQSPSSRGLLVTTVTAVVGGTIFYWRVEDLSWVDSLYLTVMTLTTVGYGDVSPMTTGGRLFTVFYVLLGIGLVAALVTEIARSAIAARDERPR